MWPRQWPAGSGTICSGADLRNHKDEHGAFSTEELAEARARVFGTTDTAGGASAA